MKKMLVYLPFIFIIHAGSLLLHLCGQEAKTHHFAHLLAGAVSEHHSMPRMYIFMHVCTYLCMCACACACVCVCVCVCVILDIYHFVRDQNTSRCRSILLYYYMIINHYCCYYYYFHLAVARALVRTCTDIQMCII
jgi:hypothetical protein